jgi:hypothetical protein
MTQVATIPTRSDARQQRRAARLAAGCDQRPSDAFLDQGLWSLSPADQADFTAQSRAELEATFAALEAQAANDPALQARLDAVDAAFVGSLQLKIDS